VLLAKLRLIPEFTEFVPVSKYPEFIKFVQVSQLPESIEFSQVSQLPRFTKVALVIYLVPLVEHFQVVHTLAVALSSPMVSLKTYLPHFESQLPFDSKLPNLTKPNISPLNPPKLTNQHISNIVLDQHPQFTQELEVTLRILASLVLAA